jgi:ElaB/YqjD/DUF883 family membrane-anchored ribosome-binding protein
MAESEDLETLRGEVMDLRADLAKINDTLKDIARRRAGEAYEGLQHSAERLKQEAMRTAQSVTHEMEERPMMTAVTAFAVGVVLGALCNRRSSDDHS